MAIEFPAPLIVDGPDGPAYFFTYDPSTKNPWLALRSYNPRDGSGGFVSFQCFDSAGKLYDAFSINGGFIKNAAGAVSSDCDFNCYSQGKPFNVSICGTADGFPACLVPDPANFVSLGSRFGHWSELWLQEFPIPAKYATLPGHPKTCVHVNGKIVPLYDP